MSLLPTDFNQDRTNALTGKIEKSKTAFPLVGLKNGKVTFQQRAISYENMSETMQEIVKFREYITQNQNLNAFPDEYLPLIAKLVHESDKSISNLAKSLQALLTPPTPPSPPAEFQGLPALCLSLKSLEAAIKSVADRLNYGIALPNTEKSPASLCVWRWEIRNKEWLPISVREVAKQRQEERQTAKAYLQSIFDLLPEGDKECMVGKQARTNSTNESRAPRGNEEKSNPQATENSEITTPAKPKKSTNAEALTKDKGKQEKKTEKVDKEKKQAEATKKSAAVFANFFKPKTSLKPSNTATPSETSASSKSINDFEATFKPFRLKKDVKLAPINWFMAQKQCSKLTLLSGQAKGGTREAPITIYDEGHTEKQIGSIHPRGADIKTHSVPTELFTPFFDSQSFSLHTISSTLSARRTFKAQPQHCVKSIIHKLNDAEVQGDQPEVHRLAALLRNRRKIPAKVFVFAENNRPGYLGTWTHSSSSVGPRRPLVRDITSLDYDYDSDAEWEEDDEEEEGTVDDIESGDDIMEEDDTSSVASDLVDWLVDGNETQIYPENAAVDIGTKRKAAVSPRNHTKKRKVVPLVPFEKGPIWEVEIGKNAYEPFMSMRIQLFNDGPFPLDPFTFVSTEGACIPSKTTATSFPVPSIPDRLGGPALQRKIPNTSIPKTSFPDMHIALLLDKVQASNTSSFAVLVDLIFQDLKALGIKKNALEAKLREVAEKDKGKKVWVVKGSA